MDFLAQLLNVVLHLEEHLHAIVADYGVWTYAILFLIVFCETGLVLTPFLPGDSLLFAAGAIAATGGLEPSPLAFLLSIAAIAGDTVNYWAGYVIGPKVFQAEKSRLLNRKHLQRTHEFYERHGGKTIVIARFVPIIRTFAPFVAGIGRMSYPRFLGYNVGGGIVWVVLFVYAGYWFGNIPVVKRNFTLVILGIIVVSVLPAVVEFLRARSRLQAGVLR